MNLSSLALGGFTVDPSNPNALVAIANIPNMVATTAAITATAIMSKKVVEASNDFAAKKAADGITGMINFAKNSKVKQLKSQLEAVSLFNNDTQHRLEATETRLATAVEAVEAVEAEKAEMSKTISDLQLMLLQQAEANAKALADLQAASLAAIAAVKPKAEAVVKKAKKVQVKAIKPKAKEPVVKATVKATKKVEVETVKTESVKAD